MRLRRAIVVPLATAAAGASALLGAAGPASAACPGSNPPNELVVFAGASQTVQLGKQFPTPLQAQLANTNGCPVTGDLGGITVTFVAPAGGASGTFASSGSNVASVGTNAQGVATAPALTANDTAGGYGVYAESDYGQVRFDLANTAAGLAAAIAAGAGDGQQASVDTQFAQPLQARVTDANGNPVQGAIVSFAVVAGTTGAGGTFLGGAQPAATTHADGVATSPPLLANASPGRFRVVASVDGVAAVAGFTLDNHAAATAILAAGPGAQTATVGTRFGRPLQARVLDAGGQPLEGVSVTFALAAAGGASSAGASFPTGETQATALTDANGLASSPPLRANTTAGSYTATATTSDGRRVGYTLANRPGAPQAIAAGAANGQSVPAGSPFPVRLAVTVTDADGNPVAGATVRFAAPGRGPGGRFAGHARVARVKTDRKGIAIAPAFTANRKPGGYVVTATIAGAGAHVAFALVNLARTGA